jgi:hypothetical protein
VVVIAAALAIGLALHAVLFRVLRKAAPDQTDQPGQPDKVLALVPRHMAAPSRLLFPLLVLTVVAPNLVMPEELLETFRHVLSMVHPGQWPGP